MRDTHNESLPIIKKEWQGNPIDSKNRYMNIDGPSERGFGQLLQWQLSRNKYSSKKKGQKTNVKVDKSRAFLNTTEDHFTWLGHASFLFQLGGKIIITDPVLFDIWPLKRYTELPCSSQELTGIDIILLSHNHRDHADKRSMTHLTKLNPNAVIFTGLGIANLLKGWGIKNEIVEAGWYQEYPKINDGLTIQYLPAKHWNRRFLHDLNQMLWGSFMIHYNEKCIYFGGDSGLGSHFEEIGKMFDIDIAFLGIGAYEPIWFMNTSHTSPKDALQAKEELKADYLIPMHYGTFDLSDEPIFNPKEELEKIIGNRHDVKITGVGEMNALSLIELM